MGKLAEGERRAEKMGHRVEGERSFCNYVLLSTLAKVGENKSLRVPRQERVVVTHDPQSTILWPVWAHYCSIC